MTDHTIVEALIVDPRENHAYWRDVRSGWCESTRRSSDLWRQVFQRPSVELMMTGAEWDARDELPDAIEVFRGFCREGAEAGLSWTLAWFFAEAHALQGTRAAAEQGTDGEPRVAVGKARREDVIAYLHPGPGFPLGLSPDGYELLILPENVTITETRPTEFSVEALEADNP